MEVLQISRNIFLSSHVFPTAPMGISAPSCRDCSCGTRAICSSARRYNSIPYMTSIQSPVKILMIFLFQLFKFFSLTAGVTFPPTIMSHKCDNVFHFLTSLLFLLLIFIQIIQHKNINCCQIRGNYETLSDDPDHSIYVHD